MKFREILNEQARIRLMEGGNVFNNAGTIHIDEVKPTLQYISKKTGVQDVDGRALGSVGKSEYSGDMDIAIEPKTPEELEAFIASLEKAFGADNVRKVSDKVHSLVPIQNYDETKDGRQPRTGYVQVDYMFGNVDWMKTFYHSAGQASGSKGFHRNVALSAVAGAIDNTSSAETDEHGQPLESTRWKWSVRDGLVKVKRFSKPKKGGGYNKAQGEEVISEPLYNKDEIAKVLFNGKAGPEALDSVETIVDAVKKAYDKGTQEEIFQRMANGFSRDAEGFTFPEEVQKYIA